MSRTTNRGRGTAHEISHEISDEISGEVSYGMACNVTRREALAVAAGGAVMLAGCAADNADEKAPSEVAKIEPVDEATAAGWDTNYYTTEHATLEDAVEASKLVAQRIEEEGIVLLANNRHVLPMAAGTKVSLLGRGAADPVFGGTGAAGFAREKCMSLRDGLNEAGLVVNDVAYDWIAEHAEDRPRAQVGHLDWPETVSHYIGEIPWDSYPADVRASLVDTVGVVVISRQSHEGADLSENLLADLESGVLDVFVANEETAHYEKGQHELELSLEERELIAAANEACNGLVVLLNVGTTFEVGPLVDEGDLQADALLQVGLFGQVGARAIGRVLAGLVNPCGRTCDIWARDFNQIPSVMNCGNNTYTDVDDYYHDIGSGAHFVEYAEGIYVGYRYFETAAATGAIDYDAQVIFPFGYGMSYTEFEYGNQAISVGDEGVRLDYEVKNVGGMAGKFVTQLYMLAPYVEGGVEKSATRLVAFKKTDVIEPGGTYAGSFEIPYIDLASYSIEDHAWVLDGGEYEFAMSYCSHVADSSHLVELKGQKFEKDSASGSAIENHFDDVTQFMRDHVDCLTRADMAATFPAQAQDKTAASVGLELVEYDPRAVVNDADEMPTLHAKNGVSLIDLRGREMGDPLWDVLLDQLLVVHMTDCLGDSVSGTPQIPTINKPQNHESDGPSGFTSAAHCAFPCEYVLAQSWDTELARELGDAVGAEGLLDGLNGWAAPATNMHRTPFGGRNFEYYSEDPLLAGSLATATVEGIANFGIYAELKHFCLNDQDTNRCAHILTWADEQTIREIYAKPFEMVVKNARTTRRWIDSATGETREEEVPALSAIMSSYNYLGDVWAGGRESLVTGLLRDEWGYVGHVISDWSFYDYMEKNQGIYAGTDVNFTSKVETGEMVDSESATAVLAMRRAMHRYLYTLANSNLMNGLAPTVKVTYE